MILQSIIDYVTEAERVDESTLLAHFHLRHDGLAPMMEVLIKSGKIQKTLYQRGEKLMPLIYYSCPSDTQIPTISII